MKKFLLLVLAFVACIATKTKADEGLWLPLLSKERVKEMKKLGMKLSAEDIYAINDACVTNTVVGLSAEGLPFKSFGTGSFISPEGLILTNYHLTQRYVQFYSNEDRDFLKYGYWATKKDEESVCHGLWIKQLVAIKDVTEEILVGTENLTGRERQTKITENNKVIVASVTKGTRREAQISSINGGNQYIICIYNIYKDVRLVAVPPQTIGSFGGQTDNWQWPRHTGDFALLRVYVNSKQNPARYNKEKNVPLQNKSYLKVSLNGFKDGDFAMVAGYPGSTREYIPSYALDKKINLESKANVEIAHSKLKIMEAAIENDANLRYRYTSRIASTSNGYLRDKGLYSGALRLDVVAKKKERDSLYQAWIDADPIRKAKYGTVVTDLNNVYKRLYPYNLASIYIESACLGGAEIVGYIGKFEKLVSMYARKKAPSAGAVKGEIRRVEGLTHQFFENWSAETDRQLYRDMLVLCWEGLPRQFRTAELTSLVTEYKGDVDRMMKELYEESIFRNKEQSLATLAKVEEFGVDHIKNDRLYQLSISFFKLLVSKVNITKSKLQAEMSPYYRLYMEGLKEMLGDKVYYPDANRTLRLSYGTIQAATPNEITTHRSYTTLASAYDKYRENIENSDYYMPKKLQQLYEVGDFGRYSNKAGELVTCFVTSAHTTSGNSGSPVINANGELIGLNFDRTQEGIVSDYHYNNTLSRNIAVDARYIFFLIEKYSRSHYILDEIDFIEGKKR